MRREKAPQNADDRESRAAQQLRRVPGSERQRAVDRLLTHVMEHEQTRGRAAVHAGARGRGARLDAIAFPRRELRMIAPRVSGGRRRRPGIFQRYAPRFPPCTSAPAAGNGARETDGGWSLAIDVHALIERVYVSPFSADWFREVVVGVSRRYWQRFPIERSMLTGTV